MLIVCVCVCVCVRERDRQTYRECVYLCVGGGGGVHMLTPCMRACTECCVVWTQVSVSRPMTEYMYNICVCVCVRVCQRPHLCECAHVRLCVCVCVWPCVCVCVCVCLWPLCVWVCAPVAESDLQIKRPVISTATLFRPNPNLQNWLQEILFLPLDGPLLSGMTWVPENSVTAPSLEFFKVQVGALSIWVSQSHLPALPPFNILLTVPTSYTLSSSLRCTSPSKSKAYSYRQCVEVGQVLWKKKKKDMHASSGHGTWRVTDSRFTDRNHWNSLLLKTLASFARLIAIILFYEPNCQLLKCMSKSVILTRASLDITRRDQTMTEFIISRDLACLAKAESLVTCRTLGHEWDVSGVQWSFSGNWSSQSARSLSHQDSTQITGLTLTISWKKEKSYCISFFLWGGVSFSGLSFHPELVYYRPL